VDVEVIVVDDGSTDATASYIAGLGDRRVILISHNESRGVVAARNAGLERVATPWVAFLDDDDLWAPTKLLAQVDALSSAPGAAWACTGAVLVDDNLAIIGPQHGPDGTDVADALLARNVVPGGGSGVLVATELLRAQGGFDLSLSTMADWDLWIRLGLVSPLACALAPLVAYRVHAGAMAHDVALAQDELARISAKFRDVRARRGVEMDEAFWLWYFAQLHLRAGRRVAAARAHARLAWSHGQHRRWPLAVAGLAWPGVQSVRDRHQGARMPQAWRDEVEAWLGPFRALDRAGGRDD
jgi:glycosyltransferase involved in cell wall biosynthesis